MAINMGIGRLGFNNVIFKRKFRWTFEVEEVCGGKTLPKDFVKLAARPNLSIEEQEINYLHAKTWIPGKGAWETITVTYYDVATNTIKPLYDWIASVYEFPDPIRLRMGSSRANYAGRARLTLYDGCGNPLEEWVLRDVWPTAVNWGELDFSSSEEVVIELTLRYSDVSYRSICPNFIPESCCTPCDSLGAVAVAGGSNVGQFPNTGSNFAG
jgi:hypothetical protein